MPWLPENVPMGMVITVACFLLFLNIGPSLTEDEQREKRIAILGTTEIPAASVDLSQFNFTDLVNGMLNKALRGTRNFFSFLSVTSYSSFAFHKVSILIYNISNIKYVDYQKFPMRYCYCLNNKTNDLADYTVLLLDIIGNSTSSLKELFKSTSIVSVSQRNESDCIYFCVMTGRTGRNLSDLWDLTQKSPVVNLTFPRNFSSALDLESILPNLMTSAENTEHIMNVPTELWTMRTSTSAAVQEHHDVDQAITKHFKGDYFPGHKFSSTTNPLGIHVISAKKQDISIITTQKIPSKGENILLTKLPPIMQGVASKEHKIVPTRSPSLMGTIAQKVQHQPSDKISLFPHNALKEHSVSFLSHKTQDGPSLRLPGWTTIAALEMLQRPYTVMPLWTGNSLQNYSNSVTKRMSTSMGHFPSTQRGTSTRTFSTNISPGMSTPMGHFPSTQRGTSTRTFSTNISPGMSTPMRHFPSTQRGRSTQTSSTNISPGMSTSMGHFPSTQRGPSTRTSSTNISPGSTDTVHTMVATLAKTISTAPHAILVDILPLRADSDTFDKQKDFTTKSLVWSQITNGKKLNVPLVTLSSLEALLPEVKPTVDSPKMSFYAYTQSKTLLPQVKPTIDGPKISLYAYTQTRCRQIKLTVIAPSVASVFPKVNSCVMELCRFFQQCLCVSQVLYSRHKNQRQCIQYYSWYLKNATYICDKVQRNPHRRTLRQKCLKNICKSI